MKCRGEFASLQMELYRYQDLIIFTFTRYHQREWKKIHDSIRGKGSYKKTKDNILKYISGPNRNGKPVWKDIWIIMTINTFNFISIKRCYRKWKDNVNKIGFQFHTPFVKDGPL